MRLPRKYLLKGQALILVLLGMAVVLTLVLSIVSTSITDIDVSTRDEEATRALNAAEAGVEQSFLIADDSSGTIGEYSQYSAVVTGIAEGSTIYNSPKVVDAGDTVALWYVSHNGNDLVCDPLNGFPCMAADTSLKICFGNDPKPENAPAIEVSVYYDTSGLGVLNGNFTNVAVARAVFDSVESRSLANNFALADAGECKLESVSYLYSAAIDNVANYFNLACTDCILNVKVKPVYNSLPLPVGFESGAILPTQGVKIVSTGTSGGSSRRLEVFRSFKNNPAIFDNAVFSFNSLVK